MRKLTDTIWELIGTVAGLVLLLPTLAVLVVGVMLLLSWAIALIGRL